MTPATLPAVNDRTIMQICWVVPDIKVAAANWTDTTGIGPFFLIPDLKLENIQYRGVSTGIHYSVALAQSGGVQVELLEQHCDRSSAYRDLVKSGSRGFHHVAHYCRDYDRSLEFYKAKNFAIATEGVFGDARFCYVDTSAATGCMIELVERSAGVDAVFDRVAAGAENWDGVTDPLRSLA